MDSDPDAYTVSISMFLGVESVLPFPTVFPAALLLVMMNMLPHTKETTVFSSNWIHVFRQMLSDDIKSVLKTLTAEI